MNTLLFSPLRSLALIVATALSAFGAADYATPYAFTTLAGASSIGSQNGQGANARFYSPQGVTTDSAGNVFIVDEGNHLIRKMTADGVVTTLAGKPGEPGSADGTGAEARFDSPQGIVADAAGNLYVTDTGNHTIRKITPAGVVTTLAGLADVTGNIDGTGTASRFNRPRGIAVDTAGNLYVTEAGNDDIRKIDPQGNVSTFATGLKFPETGDISSQVVLNYGAIAVDAANNVYVARYAFQSSNTDDTDFWHNSYDLYVGYVSKVTASGTVSDLWQTSVFRYFDGRIINGNVSAITFDANGQLIVASNYQVLRYSLSNATFATLAGDGTIGGSDGPALAAKLGYALSLAYDQSGTLYLSDNGNNVVRKLGATGNVATIAGLSYENATATVDATGSAARFGYPNGTAIDAAGNLYVADGSSDCIRKISPTGVVTTLAGSPGVPGSADGTGTEARFKTPSGIAAMADGTLFVADTGNFTIRKITPAGEVTTLAGSAGQGGHDDGTGADARFWFPGDVAVSATGTVFVADTSNDIIRQITPAGVVTTIAGAPLVTGSANGNGADARFTLPSGIAIDATGNLFVTEAPNAPTVARIRKITPAGFVTKVAGDDQGYTDGNSSDARFSTPQHIAVDADGTLFVTDSYNQTVRKIAADGRVSTVAGLFDAPGSTDGAGRDARFLYPRGITVDSTGHLYVTSGTTVRKGLLATVPVISVQPQSQTVTAGASVQFSVTASGIPEPTYQWYFKGSAYAGATSNTLSLSNTSANDAGDYTVVVTNSLGSVTSDKATLTVNTPPPPPPSGGGSRSGGGGGGGAPSTWFLLAILLTGAVKRLIQPNRQ